MAVTTSSGDGFALYNGVKLPNVDSVWMDNETYPYAAISCYYDTDSGLPAYMFMASSVPLFYLPSMDMVWTADSTSYPIYAYDPAGIGQIPEAQNNWAYITDNAAIGGVPIWTSVDMESGSYGLNGVVPDGSVYLSASDPIPLDGMNVIEWDGDTTGRAVVEGVMYKVSNVTDIDLNGCSAYYKASDGSVYGGSLIWQEAQTGLNVGVYGGDTPMCAVINSVDGLEDGLYFSSFSEGEYTTIFAYPASGGSTYDRTAFLSGMAMGLTGKGDPTFMASDTFAKGYKVGAALRRKRVIPT